MTTSPAEFKASSSAPTVAPSTDDVGDHKIFRVSPYLCFIIAGIAILVAARLYEAIQGCLSRNINHEDANEGTHIQCQNYHPVYENLVDLFNQIFDSNRNQMTLTLQNTIFHRSEKSEGEESTKCKSIPECEYSGDQSNISICIEHESDRNEAIRNKSSIMTTIHKECMICFEEYNIGDRVVWSQSYPERCNHVYHKTCMVRYLATHAHRNERRDTNDYSVAENPCPVCRLQFCTVQEDDLTFCTSITNTHTEENGTTTSLAL